MATPALAAAVENLPYYHGLLPREDIHTLLTKNGEYILRLSEDDKKPNRQKMLILSLYVASLDKHDGKTQPFKHFIVKYEKPRDMVSLDGETFRKTVAEIVDFHHQKNVPVNKQQPETVLRIAILRQRWELLHENITKEIKLGEGAFGEVCKGKLKIPKKNTSVDVAIKIAKATEMNKEKIKEVMKEARIMRNFDHPNVVKMYGVAVLKEPLMIVMELVTGGALDEYLKKNETSMEAKTRMVLGAAWGIAYMHSKNFIHRDLAARNCLFNNGVCKISDFGLTREGEEYKMKLVTKLPIRWLAPETIEQFIYSRVTDVWAFGILVWEIYHDAREPYEGMKFAEVKKEVPKGYRMTFDDKCDPTIVRIVSDCWAADPTLRHQMHEVVNALENHTEIRFVRDVEEESGEGVTPACSAPSSDPAGEHGDREKQPESAGADNEEKKEEKAAKKREREGRKKRSKEVAGGPFVGGPPLLGGPTSPTPSGPSPLGGPPPQSVKKKPKSKKNGGVAPK